MSDMIKEKKEFFGKSGKMGTYTAVMAVIVLAVCVFVNLIVASLPSTVTKIDTSSNKMYTLSNATKKYIAGVDKDVTLYYVCQGGQEDAQLRTFLDRYSALSDHIKVRVADPIKDTEFAGKYNVTSNYSVVAVCGERFKTVGNGDMYYYYNENAGKLSVEEYNYYAQMYGGYMESYFGAFTQYFGGDAMITGAIEYVTAEKVPTVYILEGHSEAELPETITREVFSLAGITYNSLNIALDDDIPEDCDLLIINAPSTDITAAEAAKLTSFFDKGGKIYLATAPSCDGFANLMSFTSHCGMTAVPGTITENDASMKYSRNSQYLYPDVSGEHTAMTMFNSEFSGSGSPLVAFAHGIGATGAKDITVTPLLTTSEKAETTENQETRRYSVAAAAEGAGKLVWIGSSQFLTDTFINGTNGANLYVFYSIFSWMEGAFKSGLPEISGVELTEAMLTVPESQANFWGILFIFIMPIACIGGGLFIWLRRRKA